MQQHVLSKVYNQEMKCVSCDFCGKKEMMPYTCTYCEGNFCSGHRLPEQHECKGDVTKKIPVKKKTQQKAKSSRSYSYNSEDDFID